MLSLLAEQDPLAWVDRVVIYTMYTIPLTAFLLWPKPFLLFAAMLFVWQVADGGDGWLWPFLLFAAAAVYLNIRRVWRFVYRNLPGTRVS